MRFQRVGDRDQSGGDDKKPTLEAVMHHYDVDFNDQRNTGMAKCPLHDDNTPSMSYKLDEGLWKCHSCGEGGDSYSMIMKHQLLVEKEEIDFVGARALAAALGLPEGDSGGGGKQLSGSRYGGGRSVPARSRNRPAGSGYVPAWRRR
ncbi:CHC2 zinc finger domain-containing protein [Streptomyces sp. NPDC056796]|uniref:CHC2 zinc finger domain-containing protein n=1 Tax=Streptomyces sp. NPDC056796 TaxID=3345947 RepID=UPI00368F6396